MDYKTKKFDLAWGDEGVVPEIVFPDTMFIFKRMGEVILEMAAPVNGERVLDVGCGRAIDALQFAKSGALAIGLDPSSKMIIGAKSFLNDNSGDNVDLVRAIGEAMPFKNRSLDKIICKGALDHFADMPKTMSDMAQTLKPTGSAIIAIANFIEDEPEAIWSFVERWGQHPDEDLRQAIATCVLEHLLERHFDLVFPRVKRLAESNEQFARTVAMCWPSATSMEFESLRRRITPFAEARGYLTDEDVFRNVS